MKHSYRATVFLKFSYTDEQLKESGLDIGIPASGLLHDELLELLDGEEGVVEVESVVVKHCAPLPTALELEVVQSLCEGCGQLRPTNKTPEGRVCDSCRGSVVPLRPRRSHD